MGKIMYEADLSIVERDTSSVTISLIFIVLFFCILLIHVYELQVYVFKEIGFFLKTTIFFIPIYMI